MKLKDKMAYAWRHKHMSTGQVVSEEDYLEGFQAARTLAVKTIKKYDKMFRNYNGTRSPSYTWVEKMGEEELDE